MRSSFYLVLVLFLYLCISTGFAAPTIILSTGTFQAIDPSTPTKGTFQIEKTGNDLKLRLLDDFSVKLGPDLHVLLSPQTISSATSQNALNGSYLVSLLTVFAGAQEFDLPDSLDLAPYSTVLIHCVQYSHLFGGAEITPPVRVSKEYVQASVQQFLEVTPNPFVNSVSIQGSVPLAPEPRIQIYDLRGKEIRTWAVTPAENGLFQKVWDGKNEQGQRVPAGSYWIRLETTSHQNFIKKVLKTH